MDNEDDNDNDCHYYYQKKFPDVNECVMVKVTEINSDGVYVKLLDYGNIQGLLLLSEISKKKMHSIYKYISVGNIEVAMVIRVDTEKGYVDLSRKYLTEQDKIECKDKYAKTCVVKNLVNCVAKKTGFSKKMIYETFIWHLDDVYNVFHKFNSDNTVLDDIHDVDVKILEQFKQEIPKKFVNKIVSLKFIFQLTCFKYEGIEAIKTTLIKGKEMLTRDLNPSCNFKIFLKNSPYYIISVDVDETLAEESKKIVYNHIENMKNDIKNKGGSLIFREKENVYVDDNNVDDNESQD